MNRPRHPHPMTQIERVIQASGPNGYASYDVETLELVRDQILGPTWKLIGPVLKYAASVAHGKESDFGRLMRAVHKMEAALDSEEATS